MNKPRRYKKRYLLIILPFLFIATFLTWKVYQSNSREVIDVNDVSNIEVLLPDNSDPSQAIIKGDVDLGNFEKLSIIAAVKKEDKIYIYLTKTKGFSTTTSFNQPLSNVLISHNSGDVREVALVSGDDIFVEIEEDPTQNYIEVSNYEDIKVLWNNPK